MTMKTVIDGAKIGKKGFPRHYQAFGMEPPTKVVDLDGPLSENGDSVALTLNEQITMERDKRIDGGFEFQGIRYQSRSQDRENIAGAAVAALAAISSGAVVGDYRWHGANSDFQWIAEDNTLHLMDAQTMFAFGQAAMAHKQSMIFAARALKDMTEIPADYADDKWWV